VLLLLFACVCVYYSKDEGGCQPILAVHTVINCKTITTVERFVFLVEVSYVGVRFFFVVKI
jgi:hypothetical protein